MSDNELEFMECSVCASKPGSPTLCPSCQHNRAVISTLHKCIEISESFMQLIKSAVESERADTNYWNVRPHAKQCALLQAPKTRWTGDGYELMESPPKCNCGTHDSI